MDAGFLHESLWGWEVVSDLVQHATCSLASCLATQTGCNTQATCGSRRAIERNDDDGVDVADAGLFNKLFTNVARLFGPINDSISVTFVGPMKTLLRGYFGRWMSFPQVTGAAAECPTGYSLGEAVSTQVLQGNGDVPDNLIPVVGMTMLLA